MDKGGPGRTRRHRGLSQVAPGRSPSHQSREQSRRDELWSRYLETCGLTKLWDEMDPESTVVFCQQFRTEHEDNLRAAKYWSDKGLPQSVGKVSRVALRLR